MFKLYGYVPELKLIKTDKNEEKIIDTLAKLIHKVDRIQFMVVSITEYGPYVRTILSDKDFMDYIQEYVKNNKPLTRKKVNK